MKPLDIILIAVLAAAFIAALVHSIRASKNGCGGNCAECARGRCPRNPRQRDNAPLESHAGRDEDK